MDVEVWHWRGPLGTFVIRRDDRGWVLQLERQVLGRYEEAAAAAADVALHVVGWEAWDHAPARPDEPAGLSDWSAGEP